MKRTERLVRNALKHLSKPYGEDITDEVFGVIQNNEGLHDEYRDIANGFKSGKWGMNQNVGYFVKKVTGREVSSRNNPCQKNTLAKTYSGLR